MFFWIVMTTGIRYWASGLSSLDDAERLDYRFTACQREVV